MSHIHFEWQYSEFDSLFIYESAACVPVSRATLLDLTANEQRPDFRSHSFLLLHFSLSLSFSLPLFITSLPFFIASLFHHHVSVLPSPTILLRLNASLISRLRLHTARISHFNSITLTQAQKVSGSRLFHQKIILTNS